LLSTEGTDSTAKTSKLVSGWGWEWRIRERKRGRRQRRETIPRQVEIVGE